MYFLLPQVVFQNCYTFRMENLPSGSAQAIEHLTSLRDIYTPLIDEYVDRISSGENINVQESYMVKRDEYIREMIDVAMSTRWHIYPHLSDSELWEMLITYADDIGVLNSKLYDQYLLAFDGEGSPLTLEEYVSNSDEYELMAENFDTAKQLRSRLALTNDEDVDGEIIENFARGIVFTARNKRGPDETDYALEQHLQAGEFEQYLISKFRREVESRLSDEVSLTMLEGEELLTPLLVLPVSEYGADYTASLAQAAQRLLAQVNVIADEIESAGKNYAKTLDKTARGSQKEDGQSDVVTIKKAFSEGVISLIQSLALATAEKQVGYETGESLLNAVLQNDIPNKIAYQIPPGFLGPTVLAGKYIPGLIELNDGKLDLSEEVIAIATQVKKSFRSADTEDSLQIAERPELVSVGRGCPVSYKAKGVPASGISQLNKAFKKVYK